MIIDVPYSSLKQTLQGIKMQIRDSLPYIHSYIPSDIESPEELFYYLKSLTTYHDDPKGIELLQMAHTLLEGGVYGKPGYGDCDCFTILAITSLYYLNYKPLYVEIVGKTSYAPTHIYAKVYDPFYKKICVFDLTNKKYDQERPYKFHQCLKFNL